MKHDIILLSFHLTYLIQNLNTYKNDLWANARNLYQFHLNALFCISGQYFYEIINYFCERNESN